MDNLPRYPATHGYIVRAWIRRMWLPIRRTETLGEALATQQHIEYMLNHPAKIEAWPYR